MSKRYREYGLALLSLAGSGLLLVVLLWQWLHFRGREADLKSRLAAKVEVRLQAPPKEDQPYELPGLEAYAATVERPLFMENRRPGEVEASVPEVESAPKLPLTAKLMGVVFAPGQKPLGLFVDARGKYKRLRNGDPNPLDGWKVVEIMADKAILEQDGTRQELKLVKPRPKRPLVPQQAAVPGGPGAPAVPGIPGTDIPVVPDPSTQPPEPPPLFDPNNPENNPEIPQESIDSEQLNPNDPVDEIPVEPEEIPVEQ